MFNGFPATVTPAIQVWDYSQGASNTSVFLTDDCAPVQYFKTGGSTNTIRLYLPTSYPEGKLIKIINAKRSSFNQSITIYSSDARGNSLGESGTGVAIYTARSGNIFELCYTKANLQASTTGFTVSTGWICTTQGSANSGNNTSFGIAGGSAVDINSFAAGSGATASGAYSTAIGGQNAVSAGSDAVAIGGGSSSSATSSTAIGTNALANGTFSVAIGRYPTTRSIDGIISFGPHNNPIAATVGLSQASLFVIGVQTTDATTTTLCSNTSAASATNQLTLPNNSAYYVRGSVIANVTAGGNTKAWSFEAVIKRGANAAATTLMQNSLNVVASDTGAAAWAVALAADTTNGAFAVSVTGAAATTIRWVCRLDTTEVTF